MNVLEMPLLDQVERLRAVKEQTNWVMESFENNKSLPFLSSFFEGIAGLVARTDYYDIQSRPVRKVSAQGILEKFLNKWALLIDSLDQYEEYFLRLREKSDYVLALYSMAYLSGTLSSDDIIDQYDSLRFLSVGVALSEYKAESVVQDAFQNANLKDDIDNQRNALSELASNANKVAKKIDGCVSDFQKAKDDILAEGKSAQTEFISTAERLRLEVDGEKNLIIRDLKNLKVNQEKELEVVRESYEKEIELIRVSCQKDFDLARSDFQKELDILRKSFEGDKALEAPVKFWELKRKKHSRWALGSGVLTAITMLFIGIFLNYSVNSAVDAIKSASAKAPVVQQTSMAKPASTVQGGKASAVVAASQPVAEASADSAKQETWHLDVAALLLKATLCFWVLRVMVRIFLSHVHLENDAAERVTMARTYLALLRRGKLPEGDDLKTVLAALFRPTGDGIVKDEGMPLSITEIVTRQGPAK